MKKLIYSIIGLVMFASCEEDYKTDLTSKGESENNASKAG